MDIRLLVLLVLDHNAIYIHNSRVCRLIRRRGTRHKRERFNITASSFTVLFYCLCVCQKLLVSKGQIIECQIELPNTQFHSR